MATTRQKHHAFLVSVSKYHLRDLLADFKRFPPVIPPLRPQESTSNWRVTIEQDLSSLWRHKDVIFDSNAPMGTEVSDHGLIKVHSVFTF